MTNDIEFSVEKFRFGYLKNGASKRMDVSLQVSGLSTQNTTLDSQKKFKIAKI